ncbi:MAG: MFS transporter [Burkholderiales bacterium]
MHDRRLIYLAAFLRAVATGMLAVLLGIYLAEIDFSAAEIGVVISAGLIGAALASLYVTALGDRTGRRRMLVALSMLSGVGGIAAALSSSFIAIIVAAFIGMMNGMGRDRGASLVLEQAMLPATTNDSERTVAFAWYNVVQDAGHALGGLAAALPAVLRHVSSVETTSSYQTALILYALLMLCTAAMYFLLSTRTEARTAKPKISRRGKRVVWKMSSLFAMDAVAGGFAGTALVSYFFFERFGVGEAAIGALFFVARIANALSHLAAAWLARRIGLLNTMVFTHVPSSLLLITVAFAPDFVTASILFILREALVEMDVPTRQSYVMAVVAEEERTFASGVTHLTRMGGWAIGPSLAGWLMQSVALATPLMVAAAMKIAYDVMLFAAFKKIKPPEE